MPADHRPDPIPTSIRVVSWNLWWRYGPWESRQQSIAAALGELDADIVAIQEVWDDGDRNLCAELGAELGRHHVFEAFDARAGVRFGNAILSRWPIAARAARRLPAGDGANENRLVLHAEIDGPRGAIHVFCTHLNHRRDHGHARQLQVADIATFIAERHSGEMPPVLCGDFNAEPVSDEIRMLTGDARVPVPGLVFEDAWRCAGDGPGFTWTNANPFAAAGLECDRRIDYVFVGLPGSRGRGHVVGCELVGDRPVQGVWPSDHLGLSARIRY